MVLQGNQKNPARGDNEPALALNEKRWRLDRYSKQGYNIEDLVCGNRHGQREHALSPYRKEQACFSFQYGLEEKILCLPAKNLVRQANIAVSQPCNIREKLRSKLDTQTNLTNSIRRGRKRDQRILIVADDYTRPTPTAELLPVLLNWLNEQGVQDKEISLLIASGFHRPTTKVEQQTKYGEETLQRIRIYHHDASDDGSLEYLGETSTGIQVYVNRMVLEAKLTIGVGIVEIHPWAGFAGGGKIISPGVAGKKTIDMTHALPARLEGVDIGRTTGNDFWESCQEISEMAGLDMVINVVIDQRGRPANVFVGSPRTTHKKAVDYFMTINKIVFPTKADIVVTSANPKYQSWGQAIISAYNAARVVKEGGIRITLAACPEAFGDSQYESLFYYDALLRRWNSPGDFWDQRRGKNDSNSRNACAMYKHLELMRHSDLFFVTDGFPEFARDLGSLNVYENPQDALNAAFAKAGSDASIIAFDLGAMVLPYVEEEG